MLLTVLMLILPGILEMSMSVECACVKNRIICPCGMSNNSVSISCQDENHVNVNACEVYKRCATCENDVSHCIACPVGYFGLFCDQDETANFIDVNTSPEISQKSKIESRRTIRDLSCQDLRAPKLGSITCWNRGNDRECKGSCLPGHSFESEESEIALVCQSGRWTPMTSFPPCISEGHCKFELSGGGSYNCTTGTQGTFCDIRCNSHNRFAERFYCYPGGAWDPPLPHCAEPIEVERDRYSACRCQNGGRCGADGDCICQPGFRGVNCEMRNPDDGLRYCNDPVVGPNLNKAASPWVNPVRPNSGSRHVMYPQGAEINFSCKDGFNLDGESILTCLSSGDWSGDIPTCQPKSAPAVGPQRVYCENRGEISNGRRTLEPFIDPRTQQNVEEEAADLPQGARFVYSCNSGYALRGSPTIECTPAGTWSATQPRCIKIQDAPSCGHSYFAVIGKIINGDKTVQGEWPWQVAYSETRRTGMAITCGAVLIHPNYVITAAHCVHPRRLSRTYLYFGKFFAEFSKDDDQVQSRQAAEFIVNPRYNRGNMDNDIALVRFEPPVSFTTRIQPVCLPTADTSAQNLRNSVKGWVTGWGTTENSTESDIMLKAELPVVPTQECRNNYISHNIAVDITPNMFCAGYPDGDVDSCTGDSGGPLVFFSRPTSTYVLEGIVSFGVQGPTGSCAQKDRYGVYTKVSNYVSWIRQYI